MRKTFGPEIILIVQEVMQYIVSVHKFECCIGPSFCECSVAATAYPDNDLSVTKVIYKVKGKPISGQSTAW